jgi:hypothetical protein
MSDDSISIIGVGACLVAFVVYAVAALLPRVLCVGEPMKAVRERGGCSTRWTRTPWPCYGRRRSTTTG